MYLKKNKLTNFYLFIVYYEPHDEILIQKQVFLNFKIHVILVILSEKWINA